MTVIRAQRQLLKIPGNVAPLEPDFLMDMGTFAEMPGGTNCVAVLISVGLLMLADRRGHEASDEEIPRVRPRLKEGERTDEKEDLEQQLERPKHGTA